MTITSDAISENHTRYGTRDPWIEYVEKYFVRVAPFYLNHNGQPHNDQQSPSAYKVFWTNLHWRDWYNDEDGKWTASTAMKVATGLEETHIVSWLLTNTQLRYEKIFFSKLMKTLVALKSLHDMMTDMHGGVRARSEKTNSGSDVA